jgi:predicted ATPase
MPHLRAIARQAAPSGSEGRFPFNVPVVRALTELSVDTAVTFLVGENGSGKSTILEAVAVAAGLPTVGTLAASHDETLVQQRELGGALRLSWRRRTRRGFFLRAEDFFGFTKSLARMRAELLHRVDELEVEYADRSDYAKGLAQGPVRASLADMERRYGVDLDASSHGESFLHLFASRFVPGGLYLLDEPEAPLSPQSQLALLAMIADMIARDAQFVIATHSPILLAFPGARIYSCDRVPIAEERFEDLEHVRLTRDFLNDPQRFLRHLT